MIYVDMLINYGWKLGPSCHLIADDINELHTFAAKINMKRSWFQPGCPNSLPHYDLTASKRRAAIANGAIQINREELVEKILKHRDDTRKEQ